MMSGTHSFIGGIWIPGEFIYVAGGGVAVGLVIGKGVDWLRRQLLDDGPQIFVTLSLLTPYVSYLFADQFLHVSGVLSVVATGLYVGWRSPEVINASIRLQVQAVWEFIIYLLNGMVFVLIGLQLPHILESMKQHWWPHPFLEAVVINVVCIAVRMAWIFPGAYLPRLLSKSIREREENPDWRQVVIIGWSGMRGIVSLAAALALFGLRRFSAPAYRPVHRLHRDLHHARFPRPDAAVADPLPRRRRRRHSRTRGTAGAQAHLAGRLSKKSRNCAWRKSCPRPPSQSVEAFYRERALVFEDELADQLGWSGAAPSRAQRAPAQPHRHRHPAPRLLSIRNSGEIGDDVLHKIEHELDLEEVRLGI